MARRAHKTRTCATGPLNAAHPSVVEGCAAVQERFLKICGDHLRLQHIELEIPSALDGAMLRWRTMAVRFRKGDFRCTSDEVAALREIAQFTLEVNAALRYQSCPVVDLAAPEQKQDDT